MATKTVKKKSPVKTAGLSATKSKPKSAAIVPFAPLAASLAGPLAGMAESNMCNFNQQLPSFGGNFETMETMMANYKDQYEKLTGDATSSLREGVESCVKSSSTFAKGAEQLIKTLAEVAQESGQRNAEAIKSLMASRTLNEYADAQNKLAQQNFDDAMSTMTKLSEMTIKLYTEAFEPVNAQMTKAMSSVMKKNAA